LKKDVTAAFFDIDHTLTRRSTAVRCIFYRVFGRKIPLSFFISIIRAIMKYKRGSMNLKNCDDLIDGMDGFDRTMMDEMGLVSFEKFSGKDLYKDMVSLIHEYQRSGIPVILATSSPRFVVEPYFQFLKADHLIATELEFDENNLTSGRFAGPVAFEQGKKYLVEEYMNRMKYDPSHCAFYSDSVHDLPTMEMVGYPVAVHPDRALREIALNRDWDILLPR
jgi:HAD superfamily hydrolase (TIGR01490 family)